MTARKSASRLFALEGPDGVGKSTITQAVAARLRARGDRVVAGAFPGNAPGSLGKLVYDLHHQPKQFGLGTIRPESLQLLHVAAHVDALKGWIADAREAGAIVLLDRIWWSTAAYATLAEIPAPEIAAILAAELLLWRTTPPDGVFLMDRPRGDEGDPLTRDMRSKLNGAYKNIASEERGRYMIVNVANDQSLDTAVEIVIDHIDGARAT